MVFLVVPVLNIETVCIYYRFTSSCVTLEPRVSSSDFMALHLSCSIILSVLYDQNVVVFRFYFKRLE